MTEGSHKVTQSLQNQASLDANIIGQVEQSCLPQELGGDHLEVPIIMAASGIARNNAVTYMIAVRFHGGLGELTNLRWPD